MTVLRAGPGDDIAALVRAADGESVVIVIEQGRDPLASALAEAAIVPLAIERAPGMRVNAIVVQGGAANVDAMAAFLDAARSTTGQIIRVD